VLSDKIIKTLGGRITIKECSSRLQEKGDNRKFYSIENTAQNSKILLTLEEYQELVQADKVHNRNMQIKDLKKKLEDYKEFARSEIMCDCGQRLWLANFTNNPLDREYR